MLNTKMFLIPQVNKAIITTPTVRMYHAFKVNLATDYPLKGGFGAVRHNFRVYTSFPFEKAKNYRFATVVDDLNNGRNCSAHELIEVD